MDIKETERENNLKMYCIYLNKWLNGISYEYDYWHQYLATKGKKHQELQSFEEVTSYDKKFQFEEYALNENDKWDNGYLIILNTINDKDPRTSFIMRTMRGPNQKSVIRNLMQRNTAL